MLIIFSGKTPDIPYAPGKTAEILHLPFPSAASRISAIGACALIILAALAAAGCGSSTSQDAGEPSPMTAYSFQVLPMGASSFDNGFKSLPAQFNRLPWPSLTQDGGGVARGWTLARQGGFASVSNSIDNGQMLAVAGGESSGSSYGVTARVENLDASLLVAGDVLGGAVDLTVLDAPVNGAYAEMSITFNPSGATASARSTTSQRLKVLEDTIIPEGTASIDVRLAIVCPNPGGGMGVRFSGSQLQSNARNAWNSLYWGDRAYVTAPALETDGNVIVDDATGNVYRPDGFGLVDGDIFTLDLTQAWWGAVEYQPDFASSDIHLSTYSKDVSPQLAGAGDHDLMDIWDEGSTLLSFVAVFKQYYGNVRWPGDASDFPLTHPEKQTGTYIYATWDTGGDLASNNTRSYVVSPGFEFSPGDTIRVVYAFLPEGGEGLPAGKHLWVRLKTNGAWGEVMHSARLLEGSGDPLITDPNAATADASQSAPVGKATLNFWNPYRPTKNDQYAASGVMREWHVEQGAVSSAMVATYMNSPADVGFQKKGGFYFPLTGGLTGYRK